MAERADRGNLSQDEIDDEAWACFRLRAEGLTIREIARETKLSRETVKRRLNEKILSHSAPPREFQKAAQELRLEHYTKALYNELGTADRDVAKLVSAAVAVERRRAALHGLDEPTRAAVNLTRGPGGLDAPEGEGTPDLAAVRWAKAYKASALYNDVPEQRQAEHSNGGPPIG